MFHSERIRRIALSFVAIYCLSFFGEVLHSAISVHGPCAEGSEALSQMILEHDHRIEVRSEPERPGTERCVQCILCRGRKKRYVLQPLISGQSRTSDFKVFLRFSDSIPSAKSQVVLIRLAPKNSPPV